MAVIWNYNSQCLSAYYFGITSFNFHWKLCNSVNLEISKGKFVPVHIIESYRQSRSTAPTFWTSDRNGGKRPIFSWKQPWYPMNKRHGEPQSWSGSLWTTENILPRLRFEPWTVKPAVNCYIDYAIYVLRHFLLWKSTPDFPYLNITNLLIIYKWNRDWNNDSTCLFTMTWWSVNIALWNFLP